MNMHSFLQSHGINPAWLPLYLLALFLGVAALLAWAGGWRDLARRFPGLGKPPGALHFRSVGIQKWRVPTNYNNCVHVSVDDQGIHLAMSFFFRFQHDPIFIPWREVERVEQKQRWFGTYVTVHLKNSAIRIYLPGKSGVAVRDRAAMRGI